jgi:hypothetical protein
MVDPWMQWSLMRVTATWATMHEMELGPDVTFVWNQILITLPFVSYSIMLNVLMQHFVRRTTFVLFGAFWGMCDGNSCNVFRLLVMALWAPISATLFKRAVMTLWHAFLFLGLRFFHGCVEVYS